LFYGEDLSINDIASVLNVPTGTVKSRLHHARESLKNYLGE
jgi:RNA polymerase sigma-70 factor (ECF subfamily)